MSSLAVFAASAPGSPVSLLTGSFDCQPPAINTLVVHLLDGSLRIKVILELDEGVNSFILDSFDPPIFAEPAL